MFPERLHKTRHFEVILHIGYMLNFYSFQSHDVIGYRVPKSKTFSQEKIPYPRQIWNTLLNFTTIGVNKLVYPYAGIPDLFFSELCLYVSL